MTKCYTIIALFKSKNVPNSFKTEMIYGYKMVSAQQLFALEKCKGKMVKTEISTLLRATTFMTRSKH